MAAAAYTGLDIALMIVAVSIGISLIVAIFRDCEEISIEYGPPARLVLKPIFLTKKLREYEKDITPNPISPGYFHTCQR
ncbi:MULTISPECIES: hypothetical protein [unclassified Flavobacterium]|uniref:hypothetical protein n=1 Tax=unclassified Flavobacterium TaxID=196869 RepID=UPI001F12BCFB|nr:MULTISPECIES: hypothetical protein [unclassified Flavobacterium]UMY64898.1 hypothetical protein MKO97_10275 [Flavobacterium sp. HJ-32-4]